MDVIIREVQFHRKHDQTVCNFRCNVSNVAVDPVSVFDKDCLAFCEGLYCLVITGHCGIDEL